MTFDILRTLIAVSLVVTNLYILGLWRYFLTRARESFTWVLAASSAGALFASIISMCFVFDFRLVQRSLGPTLFETIYWIFLSVQPWCSSCTLLVRLFSSDSSCAVTFPHHQKPNRSSERTAARYASI